MHHFSSYTYLPYDGGQLFTAVLLPQKDGDFPAVLVRTPYVAALSDMCEEEICQKYLTEYAAWAERGYAVVIQHCRGQGKSSGAFVPYIFEHEDSRRLMEWVREQPFYNGEIFLLGASYTASLHYCAAPFESDIKGAVFEVQDTERYRLWYRNGQMRKGHANWHFSLYRPKNGQKTSFSIKSFSSLPLRGLSEQLLGERADDFEGMLDAPRPTDGFWQTRNGGAEARGVTDDIPFPVLFTTGYNDFYLGGMFSMWNSMRDAAKSRCAMLVSPYNHGDSYPAGRGLAFPDGKKKEHFGKSYQIDFFDAIRKNTPLPYPLGKITYYRDFENIWAEDFYALPTHDLILPLGRDEVCFSYDPHDPPAFSEEGTLASPSGERADVITLYTKPFDGDLFIRGKMRASLTVCSDRPDTTFYMNVAIEKPDGDYRLRHDITSIGYQIGDYTEHTPVTLQFSFDEHAFLLKKGERLRIDIAATDDNTYIVHTNASGPYADQTAVYTANNTVYLDRSHLILPIE